MGLRGGDLRASERTFQLLTQTAGRAGREAGKPGRALIQTHNPDAAVLKAVTSGDRRAFYAAEAQSRKLLGFPPFGRLAALIVASDNHEACFATAKALGETAPRGQGLRVWGPAPAPIALLRGRRRIRLLLKTPRETPPQPLVAAWLKQVKIPSAVKVQVDIDPYNFL